MSRLLIIIPSKDRTIELCGQMQNLLNHDVEFDIFIADMYSNPKELESTHYFRASLELLKNKGHNYIVHRVEGTNQLYGYNAGLAFALANNYDLCLGGDDDLTYEPPFIKQGKEYMETHPECGILVGKTLAPWIHVKDQTIDAKYFKHSEFQGTLKALDEEGYYHCTLLNEEGETLREYEQVYGGFFFRPQEAINVGGFPTHLSPFGYRGEMMLQVATMFSGKKQIMDPSMLSWHYSVPRGGLRLISGDFKLKCREEDLNSWKKFIQRGTPNTGKVL